LTVGLVPSAAHFVSPVGKTAPPASLKVGLTFTVAWPPGAPTVDPASETILNFLLSGDTSRISTSPGDVCEKPFSFTVTAETVPLSPLTTIGDGYRLAAPADGIVIADAFVNGVNIGAAAPLFARATVFACVKTARTMKVVTKVREMRR
jgi:hypothetical protein